MKESGMNHVVIADGAICVPYWIPEDRFERELELIGTNTLRDLLRCAKPGGIVCMAGMEGNGWDFEVFGPIEYGLYDGL